MNTRSFSHLAFVGALTACSSSNGSSASTPGVTQTGRVVEFEVCATATKGVAAATVTVGGSSTTTASDGTYSLQVPAGEPFTMQVTKTSDPSYVPLLEEENKVEAAYDRGDTQFISTQTATLLGSSLAQYDTTLALITIELVKTGACTDLGGATVSATPTGAKAITQYPASCVSPVGANAFVTDGIFPAAIIYDVTPGRQSVTATSPKCTQIPFPYTDPTTGLTYDGMVETQAGTGTSFVRIFMK
jgi:hypothetical protein